MSEPTVEQQLDRLAEYRAIGLGLIAGAAAAEALLRAEGSVCLVPPDWQPTAEAIRELPAPLRNYIHDLIARCDPTGDIRTIWSQREQIGGLLARVQELEAVACIREPSPLRCAGD